IDSGHRCPLTSRLPVDEMDLDGLPSRMAAGTYSRTFPLRGSQHLLDGMQQGPIVMLCWRLRGRGLDADCLLEEHKGGIVPSDTASRRRSAFSFNARNAFDRDRYAPPCL